VHSSGRCSECKTRLKQEGFLDNPCQMAAPRETTRGVRHKHGDLSHISTIMENYHSLWQWHSVNIARNSTFKPLQETQMEGVASAFGRYKRQQSTAVPCAHFSLKIYKLPLILLAMLRHAKATQQKCSSSWLKTQTNFGSTYHCWKTIRHFVKIRCNTPDCAPTDYTFKLVLGTHIVFRIVHLNGIGNSVWPRRRVMPRERPAHKIIGLT
jgi:hypothetical protein